MTDRTNFLIEIESVICKNDVLDIKNDVFNGIDPAGKGCEIIVLL